MRRRNARERRTEREQERERDVPKRKSHPQLVGSTRSYARKCEKKASGLDDTFYSFLTAETRDASTSSSATAAAESHGLNPWAHSAWLPLAPTDCPSTSPRARLAYPAGVLLSAARSSSGHTTTPCRDAGRPCFGSRHERSKRRKWRDTRSARQCFCQQRWPLRRMSLKPSWARARSDDIGRRLTRDCGDPSSVELSRRNRTATRRSQTQTGRRGRKRERPRFQLLSSSAKSYLNRWNRSANSLLCIWLTQRDVRRHLSTRW